MMAPTSEPQRPCREPLFDVPPLTAISIENLETFGRSGAGWFWRPRLRGCSPNGPATGRFALRYGTR